MPPKRTFVTPTAVNAAKRIDDKKSGGARKSGGAKSGAGISGGAKSASRRSGRGATVASTATAGLVAPSKRVFTRWTVDVESEILLEVFEEAYIKEDTKIRSQHWPEIFEETKKRLPLSTSMSLSTQRPINYAAIGSKVSTRSITTALLHVTHQAVHQHMICGSFGPCATEFGVHGTPLTAFLEAWMALGWLGLLRFWKASIPSRKLVTGKMILLPYMLVPTVNPAVPAKAAMAPCMPHVDLSLSPVDLAKSPAKPVLVKEESIDGKVKGGVPPLPSCAVRGKATKGAAKHRDFKQIGAVIIDLVELDCQYRELAKIERQETREALRETTSVLGRIAAAMEKGKAAE